MRRGAYLSLAIALSLAACGGGGGSGGGGDESPFGGDTNNANGDGNSGGGNTGGGNTGGGNTGGGNTGGGNTGGSDGNGSIGYNPGDAGAEADSGVISIDIPIPKVNCGGEECAIQNNRLCCQGWNKSSGWTSQEECMAEATCTNMYGQGSGDTRAVKSECDGPEDCGGGQVCCFYRENGMPICDGFSFCSPATGIGPGAGRECRSIADCNDSMNFNGPGNGQIACHDDGDCQDVGGSCKPEQAGTWTTGQKNPSARPDVLICQ